MQPLDHENVNTFDDFHDTYFGIPSAESLDHPFLPWPSGPFGSCLGDEWRDVRSLSAKARLLGLGDFLD
jgi:hypothetical protein